MVFVASPEFPFGPQSAFPRLISHKLRLTSEWTSWMDLSSVSDEAFSRAGAGLAKGAAETAPLRASVRRERIGEKCMMKVGSGSRIVRY